MNRSNAVWLVALGTTCTFGAARILVACGSDSAITFTDDATVDGPIFGDGSNVLGDGSLTDGALSCVGLGKTCAKTDECCAGSCDDTLKVCVRVPGSCKTAGLSCGSPTDCCSLTCIGGKCGATICVSDNQSCSQSAECCGGNCTDGKCVPLSGSCKTAGNTCGASGECCSKLCKDGKCALTSTICTQPADVCGSDAECCTGRCNRSADGGGGLGVCAAPSQVGGGGSSQCNPAGIVCGTGAVITDGGGIVPCTGAGTDCCSRSCLPYGPTGITMCQPASGCRPTGEVCIGELNCCGAAGVPGAGSQNVHCSKAAPTDVVGRCDNGGSCRGAGQVCKLNNYQCSAENNCCAGNVNQVPLACQPDLLGVPRCTGVGQCTDAGVALDGGSTLGKACATSADCCGVPCVPNSVGTNPPYVCGSVCQSKGGLCTTHADCCSGLPCVLAPGSSRGTCGATTSTAGDGGALGCALYGQVCTGGGECCNGVPCILGRCQTVSPN